MATAGLFSMLGGDEAAMQRQLDEQRAAKFAEQTQEQRLAGMGYKAGAGLGRGIAGAFGVDVTDPVVRQAAEIRRLASEYDTTTADGMAKFAQAARAINPDVAEQAAQKALAMREQGAKTRKAEMSVAQEEALRKELTALGPNATEEDYLAVVRKYGEPDKVMASIQASLSRKDAADARIEAAKVAAENKLEVARLNGATQLQIAQLMAQSRAEIAQLTAALKGPSAAVIKAQEKADKIAEGQEGLSGTLETAKTLINDIAKKGGMTSTSQGSFANLVTSLGAGSVGQATGQLFGTEVQSKRDELKSVRLQLLNSIKEATGMSAQQLNSNVELKTWLDSLGSEKMTKEANLAIIQNISNRYLKGKTKEPSAQKSDPLGIR